MSGNDTERCETTAIDERLRRIWRLQALVRARWGDIAKAGANPLERNGF